jgi:hypothetical protein
MRCHVVRKFEIFLNYVIREALLDFSLPGVRELGPICVSAGKLVVLNPLQLTKMWCSSALLILTGMSRQLSINKAISRHHSGLDSQPVPDHTSAQRQSPSSISVAPSVHSDVDSEVGEIPDMLDPKKLYNVRTFPILTQSFRLIRYLHQGIS